MMKLFALVCLVVDVLSFCRDLVKLLTVLINFIVERRRARLSLTGGQRLVPAADVGPKVTVGIASSSTRCNDLSACAGSCSPTPRCKAQGADTSRALGG